MDRTGRTWRIHPRAGNIKKEKEKSQNKDGEGESELAGPRDLLVSITLSTLMPLKRDMLELQTSVILSFLKPSPGENQPGSMLSLSKVLEATAEPQAVS